MADSIFRLSERDRADFFRVAAARAGRTAILLEKDVWVVWALRALFDDPLGKHLVFKGGTSLSKAHRLIERFSEDLDLTYDIRELAPDLLPKGWETMEEPLPANPSQAKKITGAINDDRLPKWVKETVAPVIAARLKKDGATASIEIEGSNLSIRYDKADHGHVKSAVLLEFGARATGEPADIHDIECDSAGTSQDIELPRAKPRVMRAQRTLWEKATAVHVFCRRSNPVGDHLARHWYDIERLDAKEIVDSALKDTGLAKRVADHKSLFFRATDSGGNQIDYRAALTGGLQLVPTGDHLKELEADYATMRDDGLLPDGALSFAELVKRCGEIETKINGALKPAE